MKNNIIKLTCIGYLVGMSLSGCKKSYFDINTNPNNPLDVTPQAIMAGALTATAANYYDDFNTYGSWTAGYWAKGGSVNGYAFERTYAYTSQTYLQLWRDTYDNLMDYNVMETNANKLNLKFHAAIAKIMKAFNFQLLVDEYGNIPYSEALKGQGNLQPQYDNQATIYQDLSAKLKAAIADIKAAQLPGSNVVVVTTAEDVMLGADMNNWIKFANNLRLRILMRQSGIPAIVASTYFTTEMNDLNTSPDGFLLSDVLVQPGYLQSQDKQNPWFDRYRADPTGASSTERRYQGPTVFLLKQLVDNNDGRLSRLLSPPLDPDGNPLPHVGLILGDPNPPLSGNFSTWGPGVAKGFSQPSPIMLAAETYFLISEARFRGFLTAGITAQAAYESGVKASFAFFYTPAPTATTATVATLAQRGLDAYNLYIAQVANPNVSWTAAPDKQKLIIYQKWLALYSISGIEAWNEYRRTGYPNFPASLQSTSPRADKLPVRLLYPTSELSGNAANVAAQGAVDQFNTRIFWDPN